MRFCSYICPGHRYKRIRFVGSGAFADVWEAVDLQRNIHCAVKEYSKLGLHRGQARRLLRAYRKIKNLRHINLIQVEGCYRYKGQPIIIMPYYKHGSIEHMRGKMSEDGIWLLCRDLAAGLAYMHSRDACHLDIKPSNILQSDDSRHFVLSDYGVCDEVIRQCSRHRSTTITIGGLAYRAPERFDDCYCPAPASDIWSLGATLYEMAVGNPPFQWVGSEQKTAQSKFTNRSIPALSIELNTLINQCLCIDPERRPTAESLAIWAADRLGHFSEIVDGLTFQNNCSDRNCYNDVRPMRIGNYRIVRDDATSKYGICDSEGNILVDYLYDSIEPFTEAIWPEPGPLPVSDCFLGAFFNQGRDVGYLRIEDDGTIEEYRKCDRERYYQLSIMS